MSIDRAKTPLILVILLASACVIPPDLEVVYPGQKYAGECECTFCVEVDTTGACIDQRATDAEVQACGRNLDRLTDADRQAIVDALTAECLGFGEIIDEIFDDVQCGLEVIRPDQSGLDQLFEPVLTAEEECPGESEDIDTFLVRFPTPPMSSQLATFNSSVRISDPDFTATIEIRGTIEFSGGNCRVGTCPITIHRMRLTSSQFDVDTGDGSTTVHDAVLVNRTEGTGACFSLAPSFPACGFLLDELSLEIVATGTDEDGALRALQLVNESEGGGIVGFANHSIVVTDTFSSGDTVAEFDLHGVVANFAPHVAIAAPASVDCGFGVEIPAVVDDIDHDVASLDVLWYVDGELRARGGDRVIVDLSPGTHTVQVAAFDPAGALGVDSAVIEVAEDVTPPTVVVGSALCLWPPNHEQVVLTADEVGAIAVDDCDPAPSIAFVGGESSQPDDAHGDGATTEDLVVLADSVCARRERQGGDRDGRTYTVRVVAIDAAGNVSDETETTIAVNHDQRSECDVSGGTVVDDEDPRCTPPPQAARTPDAGCSAGSGGLGGMILAVMTLLLAGRRRRPDRDAR